MAGRGLAPLCIAALCGSPGGASGGGPAEAAGLVPVPISARYLEPTARYGHDVLAGHEYGALEVRFAGHGSHQTGTVRRTLPEDRVFEDLAPRLADIARDGIAEIVVVESSRAGGAEIVVYAAEGTFLPGEVTLERLAATPPIGRRNRWRSVATVGDLDGDGRMEIAEVDRPHLAGILRIWSWRDGRLAAVAERAGFSTHRIGEAWTLSGLRRCDGRHEIVLPDFGWTGLMAVALVDGKLVVAETGHPARRGAMTAALGCEGG